jgi:hypothetical protein
MTPEEFRKRVMSSRKREVVVFDEGHRGFGSVSVLSEINKILTDLMMEMRQKNLCVIIIMPTFFMLNKYVALFRASGLFHIYERKGNRGFWVYYNKKNKLKLYLKGKKDLNYNCMPYPRFRGRFYNQWVINETEYRKKKETAFEKRPRMIRAEKYIKQRDRLVLLLHNEFGLGSKKLTNLAEVYGIGLKLAGIKAILEQFKANKGLEAEYKSINNTLQYKGESKNNKDIREINEKSLAELNEPPQDAPESFKRTPPQQKSFKMLPIPQEKIGEGGMQDYNSDLAAEKDEDEE